MFAPLLLVVVEKSVWRVSGLLGLQIPRTRLHFRKLWKVGDTVTLVVGVAQQEDCPLTCSEKHTHKGKG